MLGGPDMEAVNERTVGSAGPGWSGQSETPAGDTDINVIIKLFEKGLYSAYSFYRIRDAIQSNINFIKSSKST